MQIIEVVIHFFVCMLILFIQTCIALIQTHLTKIMSNFHLLFN